MDSFLHLIMKMKHNYDNAISTQKKKKTSPGKDDRCTFSVPLQWEHLKQDLW